MIFSDFNITQIANMVKDQFPAFYKEQGPNFIAFIKAYYEWLESEDNPVYNMRTLYSQFDIDTATNAFLEHFREKYMNGLPPELVGNQRLLQKHIVEIYRTKGSPEAIRFLFRLLYNEDIDFYIPGYDIFKLSDNTWVKPTFLEVDNADIIRDKIGYIVRGEISNATGVIETIEKKTVNGSTVDIVYISNVFGDFIPNEKALVNDVPPVISPTILGSMVDLVVTQSMTGFQIGDELRSTQGTIPVKAVVSATRDATGTLNFDIVDGGSYYSYDAEVTISTGSNTQGTGATVIISGISDIQQYIYSTDKIADYINVDLDAVAYGFPGLPSANIDTVIEDALQFASVNVGKISRIQPIDPGTGYDGEVNITVVDPYTSTSGILDQKGRQVGTNAIITGIPAIGENIVSMVRVEDSGFKMINEPSLMFEKVSDTNYILSGVPVSGGMGHREGYFENTRSFLSDDKYLADWHYYQDFSYVIKSSKMLDKYKEILKKFAHPAGNAVYGDILIKADTTLYNDMIEINVKIEPTTGFLIVGGTDQLLEVQDNIGFDTLLFVDF